jgi:hypothetical protein
MQDLFLRTLSYALQAAVPVAFWAAWLRHFGGDGSVRHIRHGLLAAVPATIAGAYVFANTVKPMVWEGLLALLTLALILRGGRVLKEPSRFAVSAGTVLLIVRTGMFVGSMLWIVAVTAGSLPGTAVMAGAILLAAALAVGIFLAARLLSPAQLKAAALTFLAMFVVETALAAVHKLAEARMIPASAAIDAATEAYGPEGLYGFYSTYLLVIVPFAGAALVSSAGRVRRGAALVSGTALAAACTIAVLIARTPASIDNGPEPVGAATPVSAEASAIASAPHVIFRGSRADASYGKLSLTGLDNPGAQRAATALGCERVSFGGKNGICLHADRGVRTTYSAILFDESFRPVRILPLEGEPSRTRVSRDGRVGAYTVFVTGIQHGYASASFSTATSLVNMASGDVLGNLEEFATFRDGKRIKAADFNFWGVTFADESNTFYATLQTAGRTHLVKGDLGLRTLTVIYDDLECPSLSPDGRRIAFKKRVGPTLAPWRIYVLDLATMKEHAIEGETRSIDDQIEWLDNTRVLYGAPRSSQSAVRDVWVAPVEGPGPARVFLTEAESPIVVSR